MKKEIAINGRFLSQPLSGVQRYARELLGALDGVLARGMDDRLSVTLCVPPNVSREALPERLKIVKIRQAGRLEGHLWEQLELPRLARDAVLVSLTNSAPLLHPHQLVVVHDAAIRAHPSDYRWAYRTWYRILYATLRRTSARFVSVSAFSAAEVARHFGLAADRITVVPNAAEQFERLPPDCSILRRLNLPERGYILVVGGQSGRKNLALVEQAVARLENCPPLVVAGGGASRAFAAKVSGMAGSVFLEHISDGAIKALYEHALCLVFPSRYEGFGLPPLEAMACGCPAIVSRAASMPEVCGDAALYCDPDRPDTLAANIRLLASDPALRSRLVERGARRARLFSWESSARKLLEAAGARA
ncbi:MAG: glycosyltransferase family 4 protein [Pseudomonadota bacterium]